MAIRFYFQVTENDLSCPQDYFILSHLGRKVIFR